ncbi:hypothetical protein TWF481_000498 [Arthrobotrys musiformis]|uniref:Altered inheritance of mitochondria protein 32 n=1 Tax=Arthrobotrys musiformis TaxID=47236 RepID=A0AAV9WN29_9PEZI
MRANSSIWRAMSRTQCLRGLGGKHCHAVSFGSGPRFQLPPSRCINPTVNTFRIRTYSSAEPKRVPETTFDENSEAAAKVPIVETCPCQQEYESEIGVPDLKGLEIDTKSRLAGVITRHYRHVLIHTGTIDWPKKIEDAQSAPWNASGEDITPIAANLKTLVSGKGFYADPFHPVLVTNTSLPINPSAAEEGHGTITVFPEGIEITSIPNKIDSLTSFVKSFLVAPSNALRPTESDRGTFSTKKITKPVILTCSHGSRDERCGILGPAITAAFKEFLGNDKEVQAYGLDCIVGDVSHIGGHKFAGNVIIHLPGDHLLSKAINAASTLAPQAFEMEGGSATVTPADGVSIWYGRVMPYHVAGIVRKTLLEGKIIQELLRGINNSNGELVDLASIGLK